MGIDKNVRNSGTNVQVLRKAQSIWASTGGPSSRSGPCPGDAVCLSGECAVGMGRGSTGSLRVSLHLGC